MSTKIQSFDVSNMITQTKVFNTNTSHQVVKQTITETKFQCIEHSIKIMTIFVIIKNNSILITRQVVELKLPSLKFVT